MPHERRHALPGFFAEAADLLAEMEAGLLECSQAAPGPETINLIFRSAHTVKGSAGLFGLEPIVRFVVERKLRSRVRFMQVNLNARLPRLGSFDVVFLRNVLIYFNLETKRSVVSRVLEALKPGGWLLIGHSESLMEVCHGIGMVAPAIYRKPQ